jgi:DNA-binding CsgD family transcriptional regulator
MERIPLTNVIDIKNETQPKIHAIKESGFNDIENISIEKKVKRELEYTRAELNKAEITIQKLLQKLDSNIKEGRTIASVGIYYQLYPLIDELCHTNISENQKLIINKIKAEIEALISVNSSYKTAGKNGTRQLKYALSPAQLKVAQMIRNGKSNKEISATLKISPRTVNTHRNFIRRKLGVVGKKGSLYNYIRLSDI